MLALHRGMQALEEKTLADGAMSAAARDRIRQRLREAQSPE